MRLFLGIASLAVAIILWVGSLLADPYTSWGIENEQVRPSVANLSAGLAASSIIFLLVSAFVLLSGFANRRDGKAIALAVTLLFFGATAIARLVWVEFYVLA